MGAIEMRVIAAFLELNGPHTDSEEKDSQGTLEIQQSIRLKLDC